MLRVVVFASGRGSNLENLINASKKSNTYKIVGVISNNSNSGAIQIAKKNNISSFHFSLKNFINEEEFVNSLIQELQNLNCQLVVLAGYMKKVPKMVISKFENKIINIHPALLPEFGGEGMYGENVHKAVLESKNKYSGATVHFVNKDYDKGNILLQEKIEVFENDTIDSLAKRVLEVEHKILPLAIEVLAKKIN
ncbi:MAG: phosphoribosylglycinamide formyltransferase [Bacteroidetes bacterium]|nr:phosphoribosylglycinamide formyltransferase [Bacteroidota bacterium]